jgi:hypothetical protein
VEKVKISRRTAMLYRAAIEKDPHFGRGDLS